METVRTILTHQYPYPHEHSRHAVMAVLIGSLFFISTDNMHTLIHKLDNNVKWWSMYGLLLGFFYFFSSPFLGKTIQPSYSNFSRWYVAWLLVAALYHLPSFQSMGVDIRMNLSLFLTLFMASVLTLVAFHITFLGLWYLGLAARFAGNRPEILTILQNSVVLSIACCVFYSHCGNRAPLRSSSFGRQLSSSLLFEQFALAGWNKGWPQIHEVKEQICTRWLGPVGSASDYPVFSKWVVYGELVCHDACIGPSDTISPVYSLWATFIGLYIANYVVERSTGWALTHPQPSHSAQHQKTTTNPEFLDMVPWYSGTSADLFKTAFDLLVSVTLFLGRFDMRTMQAAMTWSQQHGRQDGFLYTHFSKRKELWFDFMADTGDGGNSTYSVARLLAQPYLHVSNELDVKKLPRGNLLLVGGDLAYPNPSPFSYERRLFKPFEYALQPPSFYEPEHISVKKPELPPGGHSLPEYEGPQCFAIPGNHDWFDGLETFIRYICHKSWLGGWLLPQEKSYFALQLPHGWWVFGLDQALHGDIDIFQFKYFSKLAQEKVGKDDTVVIITHEPTWLLDWYWGSSTGRNVTQLIKYHLYGRCRLRMAGDLHFYLRHSAVPSSGTTPHVQHLIVNGSGGAFLHPTHIFTNFRQYGESSYQNMATYPPVEDSQKMALGNILKFRKKNWRFDVIGGFIYFILVFSMFPQCNLDRILQDDTVAGHLQQFLNSLGHALIDMLEHSYISIAGLLVLLALAVSFVPPKVSRRKRALIGLLHVSAHLSAAMVLMLLLELGIETCVRHRLLGTAGYHTLYEWYSSKENEQFPDPTGLRVRIEAWTLGLYPACIKYLMSAFDVPEVMAVTRSEICKGGLEVMPRGYKLAYYSSIFLYYWVFSTPVVSLVFGSYLYTCINWLNLHFDEAFSSLRIANYKSFTRCHITSVGNLEVYTLAVDRVPKEWTLDPNWEAENLVSQQDPSYKRTFPSQWVPHSSFRDKSCNVRVIDYFVIEKCGRKIS
ncbi:hypothetical protein O6H91_03G087600 [Diphasiastrum complanatum]|uniref:Uncharacterized protein n=3 Tax=Diphasiastrum complanatum TaxID=34168 RepID=A0ACC2E8U3_DIPCM|nr:hypothetical protein O6H91_03G087600 [Diphasiastrum complanatum]KAJ7562884.1 hypothetical protein O6H91_03G087600 [Diphasiastrum complanatum]KAJ7562885.1 hypothetical protein O6H91_03G087600 [Diphasiastrum complanatum]